MDGMSVYGGYFAPREMDPSGMLGYSITPGNVKDLEYYFVPSDYFAGKLNWSRIKVDCDCWEPERCKSECDEHENNYKPYCNIYIHFYALINENLIGNTSEIAMTYGHEQLHYIQAVNAIKSKLEEISRYEREAKCMTEEECRYQGFDLEREILNGIYDALKEGVGHSDDPVKPIKGGPTIRGRYPPVDDFLPPPSIGDPPLEP